MIKESEDMIAAMTQKWWCWCFLLHGSLNVPMGHITQPLGIWSMPWLLFQVMSLIFPKWDSYQPLFCHLIIFHRKRHKPCGTLAEDEWGHRRSGQEKEGRPEWVNAKNWYEIKPGLGISWDFMVVFSGGQWGVYGIFNQENMGIHSYLAMDNHQMGHSWHSSVKSLEGSTIFIFR